MRPIKEYMDYREYLKDFYDDKKSGNSYFSYRYMGKRVKIDASHLVKIFQKQRHIGTGSIETLIDFCGLSGTDAEYFVALIHFNKSKSDRDCKTYYEKLHALRGIAARSLEKSQYEYYTKWYYSAILTLLDFYPFAGDYKALAAKLSPPITLSKARKAISLLTELGLIRQTGEKQYVLTDKIVTTGEHCRSIAVRNFQEETIRLATESLSRHPREKRNISTVTITIAEKNLDEINEIIKNFRNTLLKYTYDEKHPDTVYQLNVQLFPLTQADS